MRSNASRLTRTLLAPTLVCAAACCVAAEPVVYKSIDAQGHVTYANSPIKGGVRVELQPLTIIPATPSGSLGEARRSGKASVLTAPVQASASVPKIEPRLSAPRQPTGSETHNDLQESVSETPPRALALTGTGSGATQQRRDEVRRRIIESEIESELAALDEVRAQLQNYEKRSLAMRKLGASGTESNSISAKRALVRLAARVRDLQDQQVAHEEMIAELRAQLPPVVARSARHADSGISVR